MPPPTQAIRTIRQPAFALENFRAGFFADDALEIANHHRVGMRAQDGAEQVMRDSNVGDPIAHGFADGVFERAAAVGHADNGCAQQAHAKDIETLPAHVLFAHVDHAL